MKSLRIMSLICGVLAVGSQSWAQNKDAVDQSMPRPVRSEGTQVFLGAVDLMAANAFFKNLDSPEAKLAKENLSIAEKELRSANDLRTREDSLRKIEDLKAQLSVEESSSSGVESMRNSKIMQLRSGRQTYAEKLQAANSAVETRAEIKRLENVLELGLDVDKVAKAEKIAVASERVSVARRDLVLINPSAFKQGVKAVKVIGGSLFVLDLAGRVYVWNALEQGNPGFTPVPGMVKGLLK